jgi:hypothetical protein
MSTAQRGIAQPLSADFLELTFSETGIPTLASPIAATRADASKQTFTNWPPRALVQRAS